MCCSPVSTLNRTAAFTMSIEIGFYSSGLWLKNAVAWHSRKGEAIAELAFDLIARSSEIGGPPVSTMTARIV